MSAIGFGFAFLTAIFKSGADLVSKKNLLSEVNPYANAWAVRFFGLPVILVALLFVDIPVINTLRFYSVVLLSGSLGAMAMVLYMKALQKSDVSIIAPLKSLSPLLLFITTPLIIQEVPSVEGLIGVILIVAGVYVLKIESSNGFSKSDLFKPFRAIAGEKGAKYVFGVAVIYSVTAPLDKIGVEAASPVVYTLGIYIVQVVVIGIMMVYTGGHREFTDIDANTRWIVLTGLLSGIYSVFQMIAISYTLVIYVITIKRMNIVLTSAIGSMLFDEGYTKYRAIGSFIIVMGAVVISLS
jgi:Predicted membrane protein